MIRDVYPGFGSRIRYFIFYPSRISIQDPEVNYFGSPGSGPITLETTCLPSLTYLQIICKVEVVERGLHTAVLLHHPRQLLQLVDPEKLGQRHFPSGNKRNKINRVNRTMVHGMMTLLQRWVLSQQQDVY
jgi:hypothetical protein